MDNDLPSRSGIRADGLTKRFVHEFSGLPPEDQELVMVLVSRLRRGETPDSDGEFPPDIPFMTFDE